MISDTYKVALNEVTGEIAKEVGTPMPQMDKAKTVEIDKIVVDLKKLIYDLQNTECDYDDVENTNEKLVDMKERCQNMGKDFGSVVGDVRKYVAEAQVKKVSLTAVNKQVDVLKKTPIKF